MTTMKTRQLQILLNEFELLSKTVLLQLHITKKLLQNNNVDSLVQEAEENEVIIDRLEIKIREEVVFTIFQFTPKAADLRKIISYQDLTINLERVGDMLLNIIRKTKDSAFNIPEFNEIMTIIHKMLDNVGDMLQKAIFSFINEDKKIAYETLKADDMVDEQCRKVTLSLKQSFAKKMIDEKTLHNIISLHTIAHNLERIGDSATNIAESTIYLTEGKDIRHGSK